MVSLDFDAARGWLARHADLIALLAALFLTVLVFGLPQPLKAVSEAPRPTALLT